MRHRLTILTTLAMLALPASAWAFGGIGCTDLPEYDRAQGALQGMTGACDMSIEQARRIVAEHDGLTAGPPFAPPRARSHRKHRVPAPE